MSHRQTDKPAFITAVFSESVEESSLVFSVSDSSGKRTDGTVSYDADTMTAVFTPETALAYGMTYTATISAQLADFAGNTMLTDYSWTFTTASEPDEPADTTPPEVVHVTPADGQTGVYGFVFGICAGVKSCLFRVRHFGK